VGRSPEGRRISLTCTFGGLFFQLEAGRWETQVFARRDRTTETRGLVFWAMPLQSLKNIEGVNGIRAPLKKKKRKGERLFLTQHEEGRRTHGKL